MALRALGLGDLLTGVPALRALRDAFPGEEVVLAAPEALAPLAALTGAVDRVVDARPLEPLPAELHGAEVAVNLHGRGPESTALLRATRPRRLIAFTPPTSSASTGGDEVAWRPEEHEVHRWCRLLAEHGVPADPSRLRLDPPPLPGVPGATVLHPGAASGARRWPPERFVAVARAERERGRVVVVTGGPGEEELATSIATEAGALAGTGMTLLELAALVAGAGRVVCGDTGVQHLATAFGTPSVVLFGPVPPDEWGPPPGGPHTALWAGRRGDPHADATDPGLLAITVEQVLAALDAG